MLCAVVWSSPTVQQTWPEGLLGHANATTDKVPSTDISHLQEDNWPPQKAKARPDCKLCDMWIMTQEGYVVVWGGEVYPVSTTVCILIVLRAWLHHLYTWLSQPTMHKNRPRMTFILYGVDWYHLIYHCLSLSLPPSLPLSLSPLYSGVRSMNSLIR